VFFSKAWRHCSRCPLRTGTHRRAAAANYTTLRLLTFQRAHPEIRLRPTPRVQRLVQRLSHGRSGSRAVVPQADTFSGTTRLVAISPGILPPVVGSNGPMTRAEKSTAL
jgi:hypothetical protein